MMRRLDVWWDGRIVGMLRVRAGTGRWWGDCFGLARLLERDNSSLKNF